MILGVLLAFAASGRGEESHRGFFEANLASGGKAVFFVQGNHALSVYVFDVAAGKVSFAGGDVADDGTFSVVTDAGATITGSLHDDGSSKSDDDAVTAMIGGQTVTATRSSSFGSSDDIPGRFSGVATAVDGSNLDVKIVIDAQSNIFFIATDGSNIRGGFGTVERATTAKALTVPVTDKHGDDDPPGHDLGDDHGQDDDDLADFNEDFGDDHPNVSFALTLLSGETVTGSLTYGHGVQIGEFVLDGITYFFADNNTGSGRELWKTDGTTVGTVQVKDLTPGPTGSTHITSPWDYDSVACRNAGCPVVGDMPFLRNGPHFMILPGDHGRRAFTSARDKP